MAEVPISKSPVTNVRHGLNIFFRDFPIPPNQRIVELVSGQIRTPVPTNRYVTRKN